MVGSPFHVAATNRGRRNWSAGARPPAPARRAGAQPTARPRQVLSWSGSSGGAGRWAPGSMAGTRKQGGGGTAVGSSTGAGTQLPHPSSMHSAVSPPAGEHRRHQDREPAARSCRLGRPAPRVAALVAADPGRLARAGVLWSTLHSARGRCRAAVAAEDRGMPERRWRVTTGGGRGLFQIDVDDGRGFRPATTAEVDAALRQRELFGAADHPAMEVGRDARSGVGPRNQPAGLDGREEE